MPSFDKSADLSGWADKYIRNPINGWLDKHVREPVQSGFVQPMQKAINANRDQLIAPAQQLGSGINYVTETVPEYVKREVDTGQAGYYDPSSMGRVTPLRFSGMILAGMGDRWNHDYSTNADGTPNTNKPTFWSTAADTGRNLVRNLSFASDMRGSTRLPWLGETKNSTIANMSALPASVAMYTDTLLPKSWTAKIMPKINIKNPVPIANMTDAKRFRIYKKIQHQKAKLYRDYMSTKSLLKEFEALPQDPRNPITFNQFLNKRRPERWAEYVAKNKALSEKQGLLYPWLDKSGPYTYRTGTGTHLTSTGDYDTFGARMDFQAPMWKDPDALIWRNIGRYGHMFPRSIMRTHRDGRWNTGKEQVKSFATDAAGDYMSNLMTWGGTETVLPAIGYKIHPIIGDAFKRASTGIRNWLNAYLMAANQRDAFQSAIGKAPEEYIPLPNSRSYFSKKLHDAANAIPTLNDVMNKLNTLSSPDDAEDQGVYIPGKVNSKVQ